MSVLIFRKPNTSSMVPFMTIITSNHKPLTTPIVLCCVITLACMLHKVMLSSVEYRGGGGGGGGGGGLQQ